MEPKETFTAKENSTASQPVVFMSQPIAKAALTALGVASLGLSASMPVSAITTMSQSSTQPVVFTAQPSSSEIVAGKKLLQYEAQLNQHLGRDINPNPQAGCTSGTSSQQAASDCDD